MKLAKLTTIASSTISFLLLSANVFAQEATLSGKGGEVGTSEALPNSGSTQLTYIIFLGGLVLFIVGTMKLILAFRDREIS